MPAEQVMDRMVDEVEQHPTTPTRQAPTSTSCAPCEGGREVGFSPDPHRSTDRYRLVTPYLLRL